ncbi:MFS transporter [Hoyosella rhizosphaerae]|uniref:MFS transporter n=1 Tax=Hoyosella rhizosphaerae TaxID=1755582 RepID=A0A916XJ66_9ACTN|nr:thiamine pyrophosphate-dependent enzyme [Hoyosella rhizosphaerae]MBN4925244.1 MFS transporter [Hoyosella rhizosphaerae]GGC77323.1 MFS transporter [Hoyosella rhizosphaerae]
MAEQVDDHFVASLSAMVPTAPGDPKLSTQALLELFDSQLGSRHLDLAARQLRSEGTGFYTIGSAGHEGNAAVARAARPTDPALLHYRSGAFFLERARKVGGSDPLRDVLLGIVAAAAEPIAGGRHKVFGRRDLNIIPQTSTIASHMPRSLGVAFAIGRAAKLKAETPWPSDAVVISSFGDASANHSTALGAINAAMHTSYQNVPMPLLFVCEDNGIGISTPTPQGWCASSFGGRKGLEYFNADGTDVADSYSAASSALEWVRTHRRPAFLHLSMVRLMGHAGSDYEPAYRTAHQIDSDLARDPLLKTAQLLVEHAGTSPNEILNLYESKRSEVLRLTKEVSTAPQLSTADDVMRPLTAASDECAEATPPPAQSSQNEEVLTVAQAINRALADILTQYPESIVFGEDVARKGGVYGVTRGLLKQFGSARVFDTILDEQTILGVALGTGLAGLLPLPEIQYLAYVHNAADQIRGEGATLQFFSKRQYRNPMVVRIAAFGYQKGFGGHFHNDNAIGALRDIPGLVIASPSRPDDAAAMLRTCATAAKTAGTVCVFLEPIALYHTRDLYDAADGGWLAKYPEEHVPVGQARTYGTGSDLTILTFGNGLRMSLRATPRLADAGIDCRVVDLRWLAPLPARDILREVHATGRVLVVDETRRSGGVSEAVLTLLVDSGFKGPLRRVTSKDSFIPLGDAAAHVLLSQTDVETAAIELVQASH